MLDNLATIPRCDGIVLCGDRISSGMRREYSAAILHGLYVVNLTKASNVGPGHEPIADVLDLHRIAVDL